MEALNAPEPFASPDVANGDAYGDAVVPPFKKVRNLSTQYSRKVFVAIVVLGILWILSVCTRLHILTSHTRKNRRLAASGSPLRKTQEESKGDEQSHVAPESSICLPQQSKGTDLYSETGTSGGGEGGGEGAKGDGGAETSASAVAIGGFGGSLHLSSEEEELITEVILSMRTQSSITGEGEGQDEDEDEDEDDDDGGVPLTTPWGLPTIQEEEETGTHESGAE